MDNQEPNTREIRFIDLQYGVKFKNHYGVWKLDTSLYKPQQTGAQCICLEHYQNPAMVGKHAWFRPNQFVLPC